MLRLGADTFRQALEEGPVLAAAPVRALQQQIKQTAACKGHHALDPRVARWPLLAHDRAGGDVFPMTHEFLAVMLCVHRPGVTIRLLQRACLISYGQGQITVTDRAGIEAAACECCGAVRGQSERLPGFALGRARGAGPPPPLP